MTPAYGTDRAPARERLVPGDEELLTLADYARAARRRLDSGIWDFLAGGAGEERTLLANQRALDQVRLRPRLLTGLGTPATGTEILGRAWAAPIGVAPMAYHSLADPEGEVSTALAAGAAGLPLLVSTFASRTFEDIAEAASAPLWFQVYCFRDRSVTRRLVERAVRAGFEALVLTADAPRLGRRVRDLRNGFRLPPGIGPANLTDADSGTGYGSPSAHALAEFDPHLDWSVIEWLRSISGLPVLVKGLLTAEDAHEALAAGADGILVSNHGGRQLDGAPASLEALPEIARAVAGRCPVLVDGGVRRGTDVLVSLALGADAVLLGRPVLHGLAVDGEQGARAVLDLVTEELREAMALTGTPSPRAAGPALVRRGWTAGDTAQRDIEVPAPAVPAPTRSGLRKEDLHGSVSDPLLDTMNFLNEIADRYPDAVSFAPGRPYEGFFETEQVITALRRYLDHLAAEGASPDQVRRALFQYGPAGGQIRELIAGALRQDEGIDVAPESLVVTVGCQEAMLLAVRALISGPDDVLLVSSPCYVGITGAARLLDAPVRAVEEGMAGFDCAAVEEAIRAERARGRRPRALYVIPDHSNPSGLTIPLETREELLALAAREDILLLEDSPYRLVSPGRQVPTLKALDTERRVVHLGSYAKSLFPGARVGFVVADQPVLDREGRTSGLLADELIRIKSMVTVNTPAVSQAVVAGMLLDGGGSAAKLNSRTAAYYGEAMRHTLTELEAHFPENERASSGIGWNAPTGGFFLAIQVPFRVDNAALLRSAEEFGVIWTPMSYFYPEGGGDHSLRLSVSNLNREQTTDGIARLARFFEAECKAARGRQP